MGKRRRVIYVVQSDYGYGHGWEDSTASDTIGEARRDLQDYEANQPQYRHRLVARTEGGDE